MAVRDTSTDAGRKGSPSKTKSGMAFQYRMPPEKGRWYPAYGGGMGENSTTLDPDVGTPEDEVGCDMDQY